MLEAGVHVPAQHPEQHQECCEVGVALRPQGAPKEHWVAPPLIAGEHRTLERSVAGAHVGRGQVRPCRGPGQSRDQKLSLIHI
eukprot:6068637-Alexandrium_andersonii.AAC.1